MESTPLTPTNREVRSVERPFLFKFISFQLDLNSCSMSLERRLIFIQQTNHNWEYYILLELIKNKARIFTVVTIFFIFFYLNNYVVHKISFQCYLYTSHIILMLFVSTESISLFLVHTVDEKMRSHYFILPTVIFLWVLNSIVIIIEAFFLSIIF